MIDPIELLVGLVERRSVSGAEASAVRYLVEQMEAAGLQAETDAVGNAVGQIGDGALQLLLLGHIDTAPGNVPVRRAGDLLYGRGAVDAKGALAAFVSAAAQGPVAGLRITVVGAVGEEAASPGAVYLRDHYPAPDYLIIGEPSRWNRITLGYKGCVNYELSVALDATHSAAESASACELVVNGWHQLRVWSERFNARRRGIFNQVTPTIRAMDSDSDGLTERATLRVGFRLPPDLHPEALRRDVTAALPDALQLRPLPGAAPAYRAEKNTPLVRAALAAIRANGGEPSFVLKSGTSDMNIVAPGWRRAAIAYGPGDSNLDHTPDEHISLAEYQRSIAVLRDVFTRLAPK